MIEITINYVFIIQTLILFAITSGIGWLSRRQREVRDELRTLNGRLIKIEEWRGNVEEWRKEQRRDNEGWRDNLFKEMELVVNLTKKRIESVEECPEGCLWKKQSSG